MALSVLTQPLHSLFLFLEAEELLYLPSLGIEPQDPQSLVLARFSSISV